jgi:alpha-1,2-mannosyltransferase
VDVRDPGFAGRRRSSAVWVVGCLAVITAAVSVAHDALSPSLVNRFRDLEVYRTAGRLVWRDGPVLYSFRTPHGAPFTYAPIAAVLLSPLSHVGQTAAGCVLGALSFASTLVVVLVCWRRLPRSLGIWAPFVVAAALYSLPFRNDITLGQVDALLLLLVVADLLTDHPRTRGAFVGLAGAMKVTPLLFVPYLWFSGQRRAAIVATSSFAVATGVAWAAFPAESRTYWFHALWNTKRVGAVNNPRNRSLAGLLSDLGIPASVSLVVAIIAAAFAVYVASERHQGGDTVASVAIIGCATCLVSPIAWSHHLVWILPTVLALLARPQLPQRAGGLAVLLAAMQWPTEGLRTSAAVQSISVIGAIALLSYTRHYRESSAHNGLEPPPARTPTNALPAQPTVR